MPAIQLFPRQLWWGNRPCNFGEIGLANVGKHDLQFRGKTSCKKQGWGVLRKNTVKEQYLLLPRKIVQFSNCLRKMIESSGKSY